MTAPPLATLADMEVRLGLVLEPTEPDGLRAAAALDDASALVRLVAGRTWLDDDNELEDVPPVIVQVTVAAAIRAFQNPQGFTQASIGDVSVTFSARGGGSVYLTPDERRAVIRAAGGTAARAISLASSYAVYSGAGRRGTTISEDDL